jgi:hypothetical protein
MNKEKTSMAKLDSSMLIYHRLSMMRQPNGGGVLPTSGNAMLQVCNSIVFVYSFNYGTHFLSRCFNSNMHRMWWPLLVAIKLCRYHQLGHQLQPLVQDLVVQFRYRLQKLVTIPSISAALPSTTTSVPGGCKTHHTTPAPGRAHEHNSQHRTICSS